MTDTPRWDLPLLMAGQAQKEISHNEALLAIDRLLHLVVHDRTSCAPPVGARAGDAVIIGTEPTGTWAGSAGMLASFDGIGWTLVTPRAGCLAWIRNEAILVVFHADAWRTLAALPQAA